jgi:glycosyltransferase involved in cell wall biosynthesis
MRLLFFTQPFLPIVGGAELFLDQLARRLAGRGHAVTVLAARVRGKDNAVDAPYRVLRYRKPFSKRWFPRHAALHLLRWHARLAPDVLHAHGAYPQGYAAALYARWTGLPWVVRPMGADILPEERFLPLFRERIARTVRAADRAIAQSAQIEAVLRELGVAPERIVRVPNGVDMETFAGPRTGDPGAPRIGMLAVLAERKGFDLAVDALPAILARHPRARLAIAGEGPERERILARARERGVAGALELVGLVEGEAKSRFLRSLTLFLSAARNEGFSNANLEALAAGCPAVMTAVGGNVEIVREGENGRLVPPGSAAAIAEAVLAMLDDLADPARRQRRSERSRAIAGEYSWERVVERYEALYDEVRAARARA